MVWGSFAALAPVPSTVSALKLQEHLGYAEQLFKLKQKEGFVVDEPKPGLEMTD